MIDTRLITFLTLLEEKSYTNTAKRLYITQPAVTNHIKSLEKEHGIELFLNNKTFELTKAGHLIREYALNARQQYLQFQNALSKQDNSSVINIALTPMVSACVCEYPYFEFIQNSGVKINIYTYSYDKIINYLSEGSIDFALIDNSFDSATFDSFTLFSTDLVLVCSPNGKYHDKDRITREQLLAAPLIMGEESSGVYRCASNALQQKNIRIRKNVIFHSTDISWMIQQVNVYDGIGFMYYDSVKKYLDAGILKKIDLLNFSPSQNVYILYNRNSFLSQEVLDFIELLKKYKRS